ncbi:MAG TPA: efflux RND transporter periplasmic adaptor subunit [Burkholderiales bacterium]|nr:efflux RND transporter periplasmic adaptor subunit [Burkholderiales bacterium]
MKRLGMLLVFVIVGGLLAGGYWYWKGDASPVTGEGKAAKGKGKGGRGGGVLTVKATKAVVKPMPIIVDAVGTVESEHSVQVKPQVGGILDSVMFREGDQVKANQVLFQIDPRTYKAQHEQALAALARDRAQLENAKAQQERLEPLLKREFITRQEYDVAVTSAKSLEATVKADEAAVEQTRIQLEFTRIRAPIAGRTGTLAVKPGNLVSTNATLVTINSMDPILVGFSIPERQLDDIRRYESSKDMHIDILPDRNGPAVAQGKLVFIDNTVTPQTGTVLLKTRVANTKEVIWPGQFVNVRIVLTTEPNAIVLPDAAVQPGQDGSFVYLVDENSQVKVQPVSVSRQIGNEIVIAKGVKGGDVVITEIPQSLQPGSRVQIAGDGPPRADKGKGKGAGKQEGETQGQ